MKFNSMNSKKCVNCGRIRDKNFNFTNWKRHTASCKKKSKNKWQSNNLDTLNFFTKKTQITGGKI